MAKKVSLILILLIELCMNIPIMDHYRIFVFYEILIENLLNPNHPKRPGYYDDVFDFIGKGSYGKIYTINPPYANNEFTRNLAFKVVYSTRVCIIIAYIYIIAN